MAALKKDLSQLAYLQSGDASLRPELTRICHKNQQFHQVQSLAEWCKGTFEKIRPVLIGCTDQEQMDKENQWDNRLTQEGSPGKWCVGVVFPTITNYDLYYSFCH